MNLYWYEYNFIHYPMDFLEADKLVDISLKSKWKIQKEEIIES
jgi:hypothetical protein